MIETVQQAIRVENLEAWYQDAKALKGITLSMPARSVTALIGPSGCGKSTLVRCLNRLHEEVPGGRVSGGIYVDDQSLYELDPVLVRRHIGMVFQRPNPFPTMSIYDNVVAGLRLAGERNRRRLDEAVERSLRQAGLWDEVKDSLHRPGTSLSGGQQQRLCIARALAIEPAVLLMDEPTSALDPISTGRVEELVTELKDQYTIVIVTHNMQQAARVSDITVFLLGGELVEVGPTEQIFKNPHDQRTDDYITGRFG